MKIKGLFSLLFAFFILIMNTAEIDKPEDFFEPVSTQSFALTDALFRGQGVTTDGEYYYFSYNYGIMKTELDGESVVKQRPLAIPLPCLAEGCNHIGGISYMDGYIYASTENGGEHDIVYILKFDAESLDCVAYRRMPSEYHYRGAPWCVADSENFVIYSAAPDNVTQLNMYNPDTLEFIGTKPISAAINNIQGGEIYEGVLYAAVSHDRQSVYAIKLDSGEVQLAFDRNLHPEAEGEGLTILPTPDGALFHILDIAAVRVGVHFRHYAFDLSQLSWSD